MALMNCPECGRRVSSHAPYCPECNHPISISSFDNDMPEKAETISNHNIKK